MTVHHVPTLLILMETLLCLLALSGFSVADFQHFNETELDRNKQGRRLNLKIKGYGYVCTEAEIEKISGHFPLQASSCPKRLWLAPVVESIENPSKKSVVIVIGCNKGDDWVTYMNAFSGNATYDVSTYHSNVLMYIQNRTGTDEKGARQMYACASDHEMKKVMVGKVIRPVNAYCIEPLGSNVELVKSLSAYMGFDKSSAKVVQMAMNSYEGTAIFAKDASIGWEISGLNDKLGDKQPDYVKMSNLDTFVKETLPPRAIIDLVSVDTEGYDSEVILGFVRTLVNRYVRCIEFEYHQDRRWSTADLQTIITLLDLLRFDCFVQGDNGELWRLTGCWHASYGNRRWSNVVCINRNERSHPWFVRESMKYMMTEENKLKAQSALLIPAHNAIADNSGTGSSGGDGSGSDNAETKTTKRRKSGKHGGKQKHKSSQSQSLEERM